jgi:hypothetical protein
VKRDPFEQYLDPGERILWRRHPSREIIFRKRDIVLIPGSILYLSLGLGLWSFEARGMTKYEAEFVYGWFLPTFVLMTAFFLYVTVGRFIVDIYRRMRTEYAVTNTRAMILDGWFARTLDWRWLKPDLHIEFDPMLHMAGDLTVKKGNRGSLEFGLDDKNTFFKSTWSFWIGPGHPFMFEQIRNSAEVYRLVRTVQTGRH